MYIDGRLTLDQQIQTPGFAVLEYLSSPVCRIARFDRGSSFRRMDVPQLKKVHRIAKRRDPFGFYRQARSMTQIQHLPDPQPFCNLSKILTLGPVLSPAKNVSNKMQP